MQKLLSTLFIIMFAASTMLHAQGDREKSLRFGVGLSPTFSRLKSSDKLIEPSGTNLGIKLGFVGERFFTSNYALTIGLGFSWNQGGTLQNGHTKGVYWQKSDLSSPILDTVPLNAKLHYRLSYLEIPIGLRLIGGSGTDSPLRYYAEPGISLNFVTNALGDIKGTDTQNTTDEVIRDDVQGINLMIGLGAGVEYQFAEHLTFFGGLQYQRGISDVTDDGATVLPAATGTWRKDKSKATLGIFAIKAGVYF